MAFSFVKDTSGIPVVHQRSGGYGSLICDAGSGYHVGKLSLKKVLAAFDKGLQPTAFYRDIYHLFGCEEQPELLLARIYRTEGRSSLTPVARIAQVCSIAQKHAFTQRDPEALQIVETAAESLASLVGDLVSETIQPEKATLVLGGGLFLSEDFRKMVCSLLINGGLSFANVRVVEMVGETAASVLAAEVL